MNNIIPYIFPLMLGRTFDIHKMKVGVDVFPKEVIDNKQNFFYPTTSSYYGLVNSPSDARRLLNIPNDISLGIKAGIVNAGAAGEYLSDNFHRRNTVEMVMKTTHQSVMEYLPDNAEPIPSWKKYGEALGTHYVHSITYGGEIITSMRFETNSTEVKEEIEKPISHRVFKFGGKDEDGYMKNILKSVMSTQIKIFSSIPLSMLPTDVVSLKKIIDEEIPNTLKQFNEGNGLPLKVELRPLSNFDSSADEIKESLTEHELDDFEYMFDDLRQTKTAISAWMKNLEYFTSEEQEQNIGDLYNSIENTLRIFHEVIGTLDTSQGADQLQKAVDAYREAYGEGEYVSYGHEVYRKYKKLRQVVDKQLEEANRKSG